MVVVVTWISIFLILFIIFADLFIIHNIFKVKNKIKLFALIMIMLCSLGLGIFYSEKRHSTLNNTASVK